MIQPFKNLTIVMSHKTNLGMTDGSHVMNTTEGGSETTASNIKDIEAFRLNKDLRFTPVVLDDNGLGFALAKENDHGGATDLPTGAVIGVLLESFDKPMHEHEVMIHGVVAMKADGVIKPGNPVYWSESAKKITATVPSATGKGIYYIGLSLTEAAKADDYVDVLIGK